MAFFCAKPFSHWRLLKRECSFELNFKLGDCLWEERYRHSDSGVLRKQVKMSCLQLQVAPLNVTPHLATSFALGLVRFSVLSKRFRPL